MGRIVQTSLLDRFDSRWGCCCLENRWLLRVRLLAERHWGVRMYSAGREWRYDRSLGQWRLQKNMERPRNAVRIGYSNCSERVLSLLKNMV